jgi:hypothetical protein
MYSSLQLNSYAFGNQLGIGLWPSYFFNVDPHFMAYEIFQIVL